MLKVTLRRLTMNIDQPDTLTHHAMLVAWGQFSQAIGLIQKIEAVPIHQKTVEHSPQTKILEFLVAMLAGVPHLKDLSRSAHPIDQDLSVARAWLQPKWADHSGVSRTMSQVSQAEAEQIFQGLSQITQPILAEDVAQALKQNGRLVYDGDLTGRPVSNSSTTYPGVAYGHMSDGLHLGYQAAMVSMHSPTYGRFWLSVVNHPGDTVSCTAVEAMVQSAETQTGLRPLRRTDLLRQRIGTLGKKEQQLRVELAESQKKLEETRFHQMDVQSQYTGQQANLAECENQYQEKQRPERPHSTLAKARQKLKSLQARLEHLDQQLPKLEK
jgi:hypothetical protein